MSVTTIGALPPLADSMSRTSAEPARISRRVAVDTVGFFDALALVLGSILPAYIYAVAGGLEIRWVVVVKAAVLVALVHHACMRLWNMYDETCLNDFPVHPLRLMASLFLATFAALGIGIPFSVAEVHLWVWYASWISASFTLILASRFAARAVLTRMTAAGRFDMRVAVFGAGEIARRVKDHLQAEGTGIRFVGVFDDRPRDRLDADGLDIKGRLDDLIAMSRKGMIDQIVVALPQSADRRMSMIADKLQQLPVSIHMVTHISSDLVEKGPAHKVSAIGGVGLLDVKGKPLADWAPIVKRAEDVVLGGLFLVLALPVMALIAAAIKLESKGPVLVRQRRRSLNHAVIDVYTFRTMTALDNGDTVGQARVGGWRSTVVGKLLRRFSLDELPQLFNVVRGDMALVGPRPHAVSHDDASADMHATYGHGHQVKPGITGLAQIKGCRGEINATDNVQARVEQDLAYIRNWSLALDMKILACALGAVIRGANAP